MLDWIGEYLWIFAPYVALAISTAVAWRSRFFSVWILASVIIATVTNPALYCLVYVVCGGRENESNTWTLFVGPVMTWNVLGALLIAAVTVRVVQSFRRRSKSVGQGLP
jgi:biotin transporter BioY